MNKIQEKTQVLAALENVESQLLQTRIEISLNRRLWERQEHYRKEQDSPFTAADAEDARKRRREARLKAWVLEQGLAAIQEDFADILAYESPEESETPEPGDESPASDDAAPAAAGGKNEATRETPKLPHSKDEASVS